MIISFPDTSIYQTGYDNYAGNDLTAYQHYDPSSSLQEYYATENDLTEKQEQGLDGLDMDVRNIHELPLIAVVVP